MCRLLAYVAPRAVSASHLMGPQQCDRFANMSRLHDDGWGSMWLPQVGAPVVGHRAAGPGYLDPQLWQVLEQQTALARVVHLRLATRSMGVEVTNSHPFVAQGVGFAHNGAIVPTDALRSMLGPQDMAEVQGTTDSELYFALVLRGLRWGLSATEAVRAAVTRIRSAYPQASLNAMLLTPSSLIVVHANESAPVPYHDFVGVADLPADHDEDYFQLAYQRRSDGTVIISSTGVHADEWARLPQDSLLRVDLSSLEVSVEDLASRRVAAAVA